jgi:hypothetical protein
MEGGAVVNGGSGVDLHT